MPIKNQPESVAAAFVRTQAGRPWRPKNLRDYAIETVLQAGGTIGPNGITNAQLEAFADEVEKHAATLAQKNHNKPCKIWGDGPWHAPHSVFQCRTHNVSGIPAKPPGKGYPKECPVGQTARLRRRA